MGSAPRGASAQECGQPSTSLCSPCLETVSFLRWSSHAARLSWPVWEEGGGGGRQWWQSLGGQGQGPWALFSLLRETRILILQNFIHQLGQEYNHKQDRVLSKSLCTQKITQEAVTLNGWKYYVLGKIEDRDHCSLKQQKDYNANELITC